VAIASEITELQNEPRIFFHRFWRNLYRVMLTHTMRSAMTKLLVAVVTIAIATHEYAAAQNHTTLVIAVDLSQCVDVKGPDGKSEFQKNIEAVTKQLAQVSADSRVTVIGITDNSFTQPDILLSSTIVPDAGYFGGATESCKERTGRSLASEKRRSAARLSTDRYPWCFIIGRSVSRPSSSER
jgi:hypothetical protein